jgi:NAD(P)-dependent dehydrogenase (short-subunit alcohol dehydrogenase family)
MALFELTSIVSLVNASIAASKGIEASSVYNATKAAIRSFARTWTVDLKHRKIRVNAISPGMIETPGLNGLTENKEQLEQFKKSFVSTVPVGRVGSPDEVAKAVSFLASDESSYVTGIELFIDGGVGQI